MTSLIVSLALLVSQASVPHGTRPAPAPVQDVEAHAQPRELVVLVHGLGRTPLSMLSLEWALERDGYQVVNWGYSSTCCAVADLARALAIEVDARLQGGSPRVHFVGHSLGNIIVRSMLALVPPEYLGRVVMLAPPNQGARIASRYVGPLGWLLKPLRELTPKTAGGGVLATRLPPHVEVGVIAGEHDGKVAVAESHLPGERAHVVVPSAHTFIMNRADVRKLVRSFLESGTFTDAEEGLTARRAPDG